MSAFGDAPTPHTESVDLVHALCVAFVSDTVQIALDTFSTECALRSESGAFRSALEPQWLLYALRKHPHRLARAKRVYSAITKAQEAAHDEAARQALNSAKTAPSAAGASDAALDGDGGAADSAASAAPPAATPAAATIGDAAPTPPKRPRTGD
jgi:hypothetical protein